MDEGHRYQHACDLTDLRHEHPAYQIDQEDHYGHRRYTAIALGLATRPWCVITTDPAELRSALATGAVLAPQVRHGH
jgi:hypothetical protein